jgi:hypothetical protein
MATSMTSLTLTASPRNFANKGAFRPLNPTTSNIKGPTLNNSITLEKPWYHRHLGVTYPAGTVFIRMLDNPSVWYYTTPDGGTGQTLLGKVVPGL